MTELSWGVKRIPNKHPKNWLCDAVFPWNSLARSFPSGRNSKRQGLLTFYSITNSGKTSSIAYFKKTGPRDFAFKRSSIYCLWQLWLVIIFKQEIILYTTFHIIHIRLYSFNNCIMLFCIDVISLTTPELIVI